MSVPSGYNISVKELQNLSKNLEIEIAKMWKMEKKPIPVIVEAFDQKGNTKIC